MTRHRTPTGARDLRHAAILVAVFLAAVSPAGAKAPATEDGDPCALDPAYEGFRDGCASGEITGGEHRDACARLEPPRLLAAHDSHQAESALRPSSGQRLGELRELAVLPSSDALVTLRSAGHEVEDSGAEVTDQTGEALVLGDPKTHLSGLAAARREAREVAAFLGVEPLLGKHATEAAFWEKASEAAILHIAAHGVYEPEHPLFSRLQLAAGSEQDGFLHVHEIWDRLDLRRNRLVVLSACETAAGEPTRGDDIVGLTQAFLVAGAPAVISTLWPVDDPASARLMTSFYRHFRGGATAGESLRRAQREVREDEEYSAPYFWAGYTLNGDPETRWNDIQGGGP